MDAAHPLPPGQRTVKDFPRFGLFEFAARIADPHAATRVVRGR